MTDDEKLKAAQELDAAYARADGFPSVFAVSFRCPISTAAAANRANADDGEGLDAYGHLTWTVGNEDWIACFDARRVPAGIEYHVVVDCESGGFTDTLEHATVPATPEGIANLLCFPGYYADICSEHYLNVPDDEYGPVEWQATDASWRRHLEFLLTVDPGESGEDEDCSEEQSLDYFNRHIAGDR